ncbi:MAG: restriction endonuclease subunit S [Hyphomicrobium sp.]
MNARWSRIALDQLTESDRRVTYGVVKPGDHAEDGVAFVRGGDLFQGRIAMGALRTISPQLSQIYKRTILRGGELLISLVGNPGEVAIAPPSLEGANIARQVGLIAVRPDFDTRFVMYFLMSPLGRAELFTRTGGAVQQVINLADLKTIKIPVPGKKEQEQIADILTAYDDLIENSRRRMALLEESARLLYREWFVRLRFPGHEHTRITNGVPEGWKRTTLSELTNFLKRGITPSYDDEAEGLVINQKCIRDGRLNLEPARHQSKGVKPERLLQLGDVLVNSTGEGTLGRVAQVKTPLPNCTVDTHVTIVRPKEGVARHFFGMAVMEWEPRFSTMGKGATNQTELSPATIGGTEIVMPSRTLLEQFELFAEPLYEQVTNLVAQNQKLRVARDLLLPRLMSGEIAV